MPTRQKASRARAAKMRDVESFMKEAHKKAAKLQVKGEGRVLRGKLQKDPEAVRSGKAMQNRSRLIQKSLKGPRKLK